MICDLIKWDHSQSFHVPVWKPMRSSFIQQFQLDSADSYLLDHFIDGRALFPATGYIYLAWTALAKKLQKKIDEIDVVIEDFKILRPTFLSPSKIESILNLKNDFFLQNSTHEQEIDAHMLIYFAYSCRRREATRETGLAKIMICFFKIPNY